jgi:chromosome partitioning protein
MKSFAVISQKGGSGKTTLSIHAAVAAAEAQERVVLIDCDPQGSAGVWAKARKKATPFVARATANNLPDVLSAAAAEGFTAAIIDCEPRAATNAALVMQAVDRAIIPVRPAVFDLAAVSDMVSIIKAANKPYSFALNSCPFRAPEIEEARKALVGYGVPVCPVLIIERRVYARALISGEAVTEFDGKSPAAMEIRDFWTWMDGLK